MQKYTKLHNQAIVYMYRWLVGNLRLWSVTTNDSSMSQDYKVGHDETRIFLTWIVVYVLSSSDHVWPMKNQLLKGLLTQDWRKF